MVFAEGQQVRVKQGQQTGIIHRKLTYIDDMYVVQMDEGTPNKKLAHETDLEPLPQRLSA